MQLQITRFLAIFLALLGTAACGSSDGGGSGANPVAARTPASRGQVLEIIPSADRATAPASVTAFVNGVHRIVLDGDEVYAGMTKLKTARGAGGIRTVTLANGLTAQLTPVGQAFEWRFSTGDTIALREPPPAPAGARK